MTSSVNGRQYIPVSARAAAGIAAARHRYARPIDAFQHWVERPIASMRPAGASSSPKHPRLTCRAQIIPYYQSGVDEWITRNHLHGVCRLDIDKRTMTPYQIE
jgi:hypothetical protein